MFVPVGVDGRALEDSDENGGHGVGGDDGEAVPTSADEPWLGEDAKVES